MIIVPTLILSATALFLTIGLAWEGRRRVAAVLKLCDMRVIRLTHDQVQILHGYRTLTDRMLWLCPGLNGWMLYEIWRAVHHVSDHVAASGILAVSLAVFLYLEHWVAVLKLLRTVDIDDYLRRQ